jgi:hypothetical protein
MAAEVLDGTGRWISAAISYSNTGSFLLLAVENRKCDNSRLSFIPGSSSFAFGNSNGRQIQPMGNKHREHQ